MFLILGLDRLLYRGPPAEGALHRHHALQLALGLGAPLSLATGADGVGETAAGFVVAADTPHRLTGGAPEMALLYLEPESADGQRLHSVLRSPVQACPSVPDSLRCALAQFDFHAAPEQLGAAFNAVCADWLTALGAATAATRPAMDVRIVDTLATLAAAPHQRHTAATLAQRVQLSPDRLMHLFAATTGLPLRRYALWLKLKIAVRTALEGASLTEAAHAAGFADSAHLSHSFKAMFGLAPRFLFEPRGALTVRLCE